MILNDDLRRHAGKFYGKYAGEVTDNDDAQKLGRVRVRVPSIFQDSASVWARPCFTSGHFFVPPVGAKVWVEFEAGDTRYPLWVGTWYPPDTVVAPAQQSPPDTRVIHTPSGHTVEFWDADGEEKIVIKHKDASFVALDKDGGVLVSNKNGSHLFLDAKEGKATFMEEHGNLLTFSNDGAVMVGKDGAMVELKGDTAHLMATNIILQGTTVALGANAAEPTILGQTFAQMWNLFIAHTHATAVGPSGPPVPLPGPLAPGMGLTSSVVVK
ncbi:phage baseplate assembly protein V [Corallococcus coralloides]|uniref:phage baseplate assembly protein V n=1 Tax=Corallococcus coralloides TaxID=184914 RepID=UPI00384E2F61